MTDANGPWEAIYRQFDPEEPARTAQWRQYRPYSPTQEIATALRRPMGDKRFLILGTVGSGKSTELYAVAEQQKQHGIVILVDLLQHFEVKLQDRAALDHIQPWEVLFVIGLAVYQTAAAKLGHAWREADERALKAAGQNLSTTPEKSVDVAKLAAEVMAFAGGLVDGGVAAGLKLLSAGVKAAKWNLPLGLSEAPHRPDQDDAVQNILHAVNRLIGVVQEEYFPITLLIDGLDRVTDPTTIRKLFVESGLLGALECFATVLTGPVALRREGLGARVRSFKLQPLENIPVLDNEDPGQPGERGITFFRELFAARTSDIAGAKEAFSETNLQKLAYFSGGHLREFMRLVRETTERAYDSSEATVSDQAIDTAIDARRRVFEMGLTTADLELLQQILNHRALPDNDDLVEKALENWWVLPYPNKSTWYYPHPLLTLEKIKR